MERTLVRKEEKVIEEFDKKAMNFIQNTIHFL